MSFSAKSSNDRSSGTADVSVVSRAFPGPGRVRITAPTQTGWDPHATAGCLIETRAYSAELHVGSIPLARSIDPAGCQSPIESSRFGRRCHSRIRGRIERWKHGLSGPTTCRRPSQLDSGARSRTQNFEEPTYRQYHQQLLAFRTSTRALDDALAMKRALHSCHLALVFFPVSDAQWDEPLSLRKWRRRGTLPLLAPRPGLDARPALTRTTISSALFPSPPPPSHPSLAAADITTPSPRAAATTHAEFTDDYDASPAEDAPLDIEARSRRCARSQAERRRYTSASTYCALNRWRRRSTTPRRGDGWSVLEMDRHTTLCTTACRRVPHAPASVEAGADGAA
ncbi:hypothetical protein FB451DRAFT_1404026 [Mycena latifolia]|nr:hypothetical protein FB451DRAFT_1404026 [Mycena latifolia]